MVAFFVLLNMNKSALFDQIKKKSSYLCVGLDSDIDKIPKHLLKEEDPIFEFNKQIIDATADFAVAYKPNLAFYESQGAKGWETLAKTVAYIPDDILTIADAKRGDIGNTSLHYAKAFFDELKFDAITLAPYMGIDSIKPFLNYPDKWAIVLALTSNESSKDFEQLVVDGKEGSSKKLFETVLEKGETWGTPDNLMYVVGATKADQLQEIRAIVPDHFLLVPGVGAQGGSLEEVSKNGMNESCGLLVNSSRGIIFSASDTSFASSAGQQARNLQEEMSEYLNKYCF
jgi:orotidine-5'-phosphate decarboxylase